MKWILRQEEYRLLSLYLVGTGIITLLGAWIWSHSVEGGAVVALSERGTRGDTNGGQTSAAMIVASSPNLDTLLLALGIHLLFLAMSYMATRGLVNDFHTSASSDSLRLFLNLSTLHLIGTFILHLIAVLLGAPIGSRFIKTLLWASIASSLSVVPPGCFLLSLLHSSENNPKSNFTLSKLLFPLRSFCSVLRQEGLSGFFFVTTISQGKERKEETEEEAEEEAEEETEEGGGGEGEEEEEEEEIAETGRGREGRRERSKRIEKEGITVGRRGRERGTTGRRTGKRRERERERGRGRGRGSNWRVILLFLFFNSISTLSGAWLGAIPAPLDWDLPWQLWPIASVYSTLAGYSVGCLLMLLLLSFSFYFREK